MRDFLWEGDEGKGSHLVSWVVVGRPVDQGGLEMGNLRLRNKALLDKWLWCFALVTWDHWE